MRVALAEEHATQLKLEAGQSKRNVEITSRMFAADKLHCAMCLTSKPALVSALHMWIGLRAAVKYYDGLLIDDALHTFKRRWHSNANDPLGNNRKLYIYIYICISLFIHLLILVFSNLANVFANY